MNVIVEHKEPDQMLSQLDDTSTIQFTMCTSISSVAASGVLCGSFIFSVRHHPMSQTTLTSAGAWTKTHDPDKPILLLGKYTLRLQTIDVDIVHAN